jgi:small GTP-binding protein
MKNIRDKEQLNIVMIGHVDHGKSTVIGRLLADTKSLPEGRLGQVKATCARNAKPFEYAFLLDAPGHVEFLKNMLTGAARAEAAFLVIDVKEGIQKNSRPHGYMASMLGISQVSVLVNKMDLIGYDESKFSAIQQEYTHFLAGLNVQPQSFIPVSATEGVNIISSSPETSWHKGPSALELDSHKFTSGSFS